MGKLISGLLLITTYLSIAAHGWPESPPENRAKLHFFIQYVEGGPCPTTFDLVRAFTPQSPTNFGRILIEDIPMTVGPSIKSEQLGRAQGLLTYADRETQAALLNYVFDFRSGPYNGSTINFIGRIQISGNLLQRNEFQVQGGTGVFRFASGYGILSTYTYNGAIAYGVLEVELYTTYVDDSIIYQEAKL